jgi:dTDP-4-dehydrorhamnose 3,5-epimerase
MRATSLALTGVRLLEPNVHGDARGWFMEVWNDRELSELGIAARFVQENHSRSACWTLRGLHYQRHHPQGKLVRVLRGSLFDVVVDLRLSSATFGQWIGLHLSERTQQFLWVPPGCAHGFLAMEEATEIIYAVTDYWFAEDERVLCWDDPQVGVRWPLPAGRAPILSERDRAGASLKATDVYP